MLGCGDRVNIEDTFEWKPDELFPVQRDREGNGGADYTVVYIKLDKDAVRHLIALKTGAMLIVGALLRALNSLHWLSSVYYMDPRRQ